MFNLNNSIFATPKSLYDSGTSFVKNHPVLTLSAATLTSAAVAGYFFSAPSVSSFPEIRVKVAQEEGMFFNKITTKIEIDQIENPTLYDQAVNFIKAGTFATIKKTPQSQPLSGKYEFSSLGNLLYYPVYSIVCQEIGHIIAHVTADQMDEHFHFHIKRNKIYLHAIFTSLHAAPIAFALDQIKEYFLRV